MRIRSIKPEFWTSEDVAALDWATRLLFIGLWSYVDDNGVGRDNVKLIKADLFPLEDDPRDTLATVSRGLQALCDGGQITRYNVAGKPFLYVNAWDDHQRIDRPNKPRYPLPTCENAVIRDTLARPSRDPRETPSTGAVEQGNRGTEEQRKKDSSSPAARSTVGAFDMFWEHYPRKVGKDAGRKAFDRALRRADVETIVLGAKRYAADPNLPEMQYVPHPSKWLNDGRWDDPPLPPRPTSGKPGPRPSGHRDQLPW